MINPIIVPSITAMHFSPSLIQSPTEMQFSEHQGLYPSFFYLPLAIRHQKFNPHEIHLFPVNMDSNLLLVIEVWFTTTSEIMESELETEIFIFLSQNLRKGAGKVSASTKLWHFANFNLPLLKWLKR